jgi:hypothetical protein
VQPNYQVFLETFDLSRADLLTLLNLREDDAARYQKVAEWSNGGRARLMTFSAFTTRPGNRVNLQSADEVRYGIEWEQSAKEDEAPFPTAFETRDAGEVIEMDLNGEEGGPVAIALSFRSTRLLKFEEQAAAPGRIASTISKPVFATRNLNTSINLTTDAPRLIGTLNEPTSETIPANSVRVVFLRVRPNAIPVVPAPETGSYRLEYAFYSLERKAGRDLLLAHADSQQCYEALTALAADNKAVLEHVSVHMVRSGERGIVGENVEVQYPTEFDLNNGTKAAEPPVAAPASTPGDPAAGPEDTAAAPSATPVAPPAKAPAAKPGFLIGTAYEIRATGFHSEVDLVADPSGSSVNLQLAPTFDRYAGKLKTVGLSAKYPPQPLFESRKLTANLNATPGRQQFLSTFNHSGDTGVNGAKDDGRVILGFVRAVPVP